MFQGCFNFARRTCDPQLSELIREIPGRDDAEAVSGEMQKPQGGEQPLGLIYTQGGEE